MKRQWESTNQKMREKKREKRHRKEHEILGVQKCLWNPFNFLWKGSVFPLSGNWSLIKFSVQNGETVLRKSLKLYLTLRAEHFFFWRSSQMRCCPQSSSGVLEDCFLTVSPLTGGEWASHVPFSTCMNTCVPQNKPMRSVIQCPHATHEAMRQSYELV